MVDERTRFTKGVDQIVQQHSSDRDTLSKKLAQYVMYNTDKFIALESTLSSHYVVVEEGIDKEEHGTA